MEIATTTQTALRFTGGTVRTVCPDGDPVAVYLEGLSPGTRRTTRTRLESAARVLSNGVLRADSVPWPELRHRHLVALQSRLRDQGLAPGTINGIVATVRAVLKVCWRLELLAGEDYHRTIDIKPVKGSRLPAGRHVETRELEELIEACGRGRGPTGRRDAALVSVLFGAGLRRAEASGLTVGDYDPATGRIVVQGKGGKEREVFLPPGGRENMSRWLSIRGTDDGPLFTRCRKGSGGCVILDAITETSIYKALARRARQAGLDAVSPHDLRRSFAGHSLDAGVDLATTQRAMGHSSPDTTSRYDRRPSEALRKAAGRLIVPVAG